ncbi:MAG: glycine cleavage system aminomethyltransferase GcvT [Clostridia bacterium]|nr:glycine cleavage system aminomethyltransferase GcvT [Clostridia bacterium]
MTEELKKTSLCDTHVKYGGKMVPFAGWYMPVQYKGVIDEHMNVRTKVGMFDVSHMGEIVVKGPDALKNLNLLLTNDFNGMHDGQARYSPMCNEEGGVVDDLIAYKKNDEEYLLVVNAANKDKDFAWILAHKTGDVEITDISATVGQIALQGPLAKQVLLKLVRPEDIPAEYYACVFNIPICGTEAMISTTGYTGEDGVEIYMPWDKAPVVWEALMEAGAEEGIMPCGLGARDTLRLEAGMPLYGHEMDDTISPKEAGLGIFVKMDKEDFIGKAALEAMGAPKRRKVGLKVTGRGIVREHQDVFLNGEKIGVTTSGTFCPFLNGAYANALVDADHREIGTKVEVDVRGRRVECEIVKSQFYKR